MTTNNRYGLEQALMVIKSQHVWPTPGGVGQP